MCLLEGRREGEKGPKMASWTVASDEVYRNNTHTLLKSITMDVDMQLRPIC